SPAQDPLEPLEIRLAPGASQAQAPDLGELLSLRDKKQVRAEDDDNEREQPAKAKPKPAPAVASVAGGLEKRLEQMSSNAPESAPAEPQPEPDGPQIGARAGPVPLPCEKCMGTKFLPRLPFVPYVSLQRDMPNPAAAVPWQYCPQCQHEANNSALLQAEAERLKTVPEAHRRWVERTGLQLLYAETHHVALHAQLSEASLRQVAGALEKLAQCLEEATFTTVLCQTRPATHELLIFSDQKGTTAYKHIRPRQGGEDDERHRQFVMAVPGAPPVENQALFRLGRMFMAEATDGKAPAWLEEGFAAWCENAVAHRILNYPQTAAADAVKPGENWNAALRRLASQGKLPRLDHVFSMSRGNMTPTDYAAGYSLVEFLLKSNPREFVRFVLELRSGTATAAALDRVLGRNVGELQALWAQRVASGQ
ncbi:MAG: hypothetical protein ABSE73_32535, partial [Planctomycetota bacterium]